MNLHFMRSSSIVSCPTFCSFDGDLRVGILQIDLVVQLHHELSGSIFQSKKYKMDRSILASAVPSAGTYSCL